VAPYLAARLEQIGIAAITIHGRTTEMKFTGQARLDGIAAVVAACQRIPVIGNGDVRTPEDAVRMFQVTKCAGIMIGRGALSRPWLFRDIHSLLTAGTVPPPPSIEQKCQLIRDHFYNLMRFRNERVAVLEFRKRISWYAKQMHPCRMLRDQMRLIDSPADFERSIEAFLAWRLAFDQRVAMGLEQLPDEAEELAA
jgi:tRNA-dihydrouridine synthase